MSKNKKGLTLIELLAVITIIAILFVLSVPTVSNTIKKSKVTGIINDFSYYEKTLYEYYLDEEERHWSNYFKEGKEFLGDKSKNKNPFGNHYYIARQGENKIGIKTFDEEGNEYKMLFVVEEGEINVEKQGFGNEKDEITVETEEEKTMCETRKIKEDPISDYSYTEVADGIKIVKYIGNKKTAIIPCEINGKKVVEIGEASTDTKNAFRAKKMNEIVIPNTVKRIGSYAMSDNYLKEVYIPDSVEEIGMWSYYVNNLEYIRLSTDLRTMQYGITANNNKSKKGYVYFYNENEMKNSNYKISSNGDAIYTNNFENIVVGSKKTMNTEEFQNVKIIELHAFAYIGLTEMKIPRSVTSIGYTAFNRNNLKEILIPESLRGKYTEAHVAPRQFTTDASAQIKYY